MLLDDPVRHRQAQPRPGGLRGIEGIKDVRHIVGRNPFAGVPNAYLNPRRFSLRGHSLPTPAVDRSRRHGERAPGRHGLERVEEQIEKRRGFISCDEQSGE